jgi:hypothetical protein
VDKWPNALVDFARWIKRDFSPVKEPTFLGVHLDLPFRFGLMAVLYSLLSKKTTTLKGEIAASDPGIGVKS